MRYALLFILLVLGHPAAAQSPATAGLVRLDAIAPGIAQVMNYAGTANVTGAPLNGYGAAVCWLRPETAAALLRVEARLKLAGLGLVMHDCYRPRRAVRALLDWADAPEGARRSPFNPLIDRSALVARGFIAARSRHSLGTAVDVGLRPAGTALSAAAITDCRRVTPPSLDTGTTFDCFDALSDHRSTRVSVTARRHRRLLRDAMTAEGFRAYDKEWWHYELLLPRGTRAEPLDVPILP